MKSDNPGKYEDGVWKACTDAQPMCMGQAAMGSCTCSPKNCYCSCGEFIPRVGLTVQEGLLCIECANNKIPILLLRLEKAEASRDVSITDSGEARIRAADLRAELRTTKEALETARDAGFKAAVAIVQEQLALWDAGYDEPIRVTLETLKERSPEGETDR